MKSDNYVCPMCSDLFDIDKRLPRLINVCGHSICSSCLEKILTGEKTPQCPLDGIELSQTTGVDQYPVNFKLRELIEERSAMEFCQIHKKELTFVCVDENQKICNYCLEDHQEQGHKFQILNKHQGDADFYENKISKENDIFCCPVCYEEFDHLKRLPRFLFACGHSICGICLRKILKDSTLKCPLDKIETLKSDQYPANIQFKQLLEERAYQKFCEIHKKEVTFACICLEKNEKLCNCCLEDHQEQGHKLQNLEKLKDKSTLLRNQVLNLYKKIEKYRNETLRILEKSRTDRIKKIKERFKEIGKASNESENELIFETEALINLEKAQFERLLGADSKLVDEISNTYSDLSTILKEQSFPLTEEYYSEIEEYVNRWKNKLDLDEAIIQIQEGFKRMDEMFDACFQEKEMLGYESGVPLLDPLEALINIISDNDEAIIKWDPQIGVTYFEHNNMSLSSLLEYKYSDGKLEIASRDLTDQILLNVLKSTDESKLKHFAVKLDIYNLKYLSISFSTEPLNKDLQILYYISKRMKVNVALDLKLSSEVACKDLFRILEKGSLSFSSIKIHIITNDQISGNKKLVPSICSILPKANNLKVLSVRFPQLQFLQSDLKEMSKKIQALDLTCLESFELDLQEISVKDEEISEVFVLLPNIKQYSLILSGTKITDKTLELCAKNTLCSASLLESFTLKVDGTDVTDCGLNYILKNIQPNKMETLKLSLDKTQNTGEILSCSGSPNTKHQITVNKKFFPLAYSMLSKANNLKRLSVEMHQLQFIPEELTVIFQKIQALDLTCLESFQLDLPGTPINDEMITQVFVALPNIREYSLILSGTKITDKSLELCSKNTLSSAPLLESFTLKVDRTDITDCGLNSILNSLQTDNIKALDLSLKKIQHTSESLNLLFSAPNCCKLSLTLENINDKALEIFIHDTLSSMKLLERLFLKFTKINIGEARVIDLIKSLPENLLSACIESKLTSVTHATDSVILKKFTSTNKLERLSVRLLATEWNLDRTEDSSQNSCEYGSD